MFSELYLENFKSFEKFNADFTKIKNYPKKAIVIYGENGAGKSNIVYAFQFLQESIQTLDFQIQFNELMDRETIYKSKKSLLRVLSEMRPMDFLSLAEDCVMVDAEGKSVVEYHFVIDGAEGNYRLAFDTEGVKEESLYYRIKTSRGDLFKITNDKVMLSKSVFYNTELREMLEELIQQYWGKHTLLSILNKEFREKNKSYFSERINQNFFKVFDFFRSFITKCKKSHSISQIGGLHYRFLNRLDVGKILKKEEKTLQKKEDVLRIFLTALVSDVKDVYYKTWSADDPEYIEYELMFKKRIGNQLRDISVHLESTGTINLIELLAPVLEAYIGNTVIIDEADTGIHDLLFNELIKHAVESMEGQMILTTHNTTLLNEISHEYIYILLLDENGNKKLVSLGEFERIYPNHNVQTRYLEGLYGGVPFIGYFDFEEIKDVLNG